MTKKNHRKKAIQQKYKQEILFEIYGITILSLSVIAMASLGAIGRNLSYLSRFIVGTWDFLIPMIGIGLGIFVMIKRKWPEDWTPQMTGIVLTFLSILAFTHFFLFQDLQQQGFKGSIMDKTWEILIEERQSRLPTDVGGGMVGAIIYTLFSFLFAEKGTIVALLALFLSGLLLITGFSYVRFFRSIKKLVQKKKKSLKKSLAKRWKKKKSRKRNNRMANSVFPNFPPESPLDTETPTISDFEEKESKSSPKINVSLKNDEQKTEPTITTMKVEFASENEPKADYRLPSLSLLQTPPKTNSAGKQDLNANAKKLEGTLESFGVQARVIHIHRGPSVTRYEVQPQMGVKVSRIVNLADDLALALAAKDIRIEAPIPGKAAIGIEVPNPEIAVVGLRDVLESEAYQNARSKLSISLGRDITGGPMVADLTKMPHLLVAGATGSGKSVCINGIVVSLLYKAKPHEVKLMMIDPKMVELNIYNGIPHLLAPVVTDPRKAALALKKVVAEMEKRYELFAKEGARDIERYNQMMKEKGENLLPYIVVIVDELADLMMVAPTDVEDAICRLAQMARAAGIHLILATQRPSVDVITGVIKANIPSRIAFAVSSQADSRTILDMGGAEKLLGRGDMLFLPVGAVKPIRVQGAFLTDEEVDKVIQFVKTQQEAEYNEEMIPQTNEVQESLEVSDELFPQAVQLVIEAKTASISLLQRRLRIGYSRAARLIDLMEDRGVVGPYEGSKPREVLISADQWLEKKKVAK